MPGIAGIISRKPPAECGRIVQSMVGAMLHEPFYISGLYSAPDLQGYAGWVALDGSLAAHQPFYNEQRDIVLILSGECFLDCSEISTFSRREHDIGSRPGDWLVHLYEAQGDAFFKHLNGLFSGVLFDLRRKKVFLFNDRYGFDRLYLAETADGLFFASEAKALLSILPQTRAFDLNGVSQFLTFGCTIHGDTLFRGVKLLPGGSLWSFDSNGCAKGVYFTPAEWEKLPALSVPEFVSRFEETFKKVLPRYLDSAGRLGISLTAGLDTRMIMACLPDLLVPPASYTFAGPAGDILDSRLAARIASVCGLDHHVLRIGPDFFSKFGELMDRTIFRTDGCLGATGAHEIYLNRQARSLSRVRLTGVFGGEILRGISTFKPLGLSRNMAEIGVHGDSTGFLSEEIGHPVTFAAFKEIPWNIFGSVAACRSQVSFRTPYLDNELVPLSYQAPDEFRTSSFPALHLIRNNSLPLAAIPTDMALGGTAGPFARLARRCSSKITFKLDYLANDGLPHSLSPLDPLLDTLYAKQFILGHHKFLRYRRWFRGELAGAVLKVARNLSACPGFWNVEAVNGMVDQHIAGRKNYTQELNAFLTLEAVERLILRKNYNVESGVLA